MMADVQIGRMRHVAVQAALSAGRVQAARFGRSPRVRAGSRHDLKLEIDELCENRIVRILKRAYPDHGLMAEECGCENIDAEFVWIVDPLDGSVNFYHAIPHFCVSIACYRRSRPDGELLPLLGLVYAPLAGDMHIGMQGRGAFLNGKPIRAGSGRSLAEALIGISFGSREDIICRMERLNAVLVRSVRKVRIFGSTALDLVHIACGKISGLVQGGVRNWDYAAARIILEQSGGRFQARSVDGNRWEILASEPDIFEELKGLIEMA